MLKTTYWIIPFHTRRNSTKVIEQKGNKGKNQTWPPHSQSRAPSRASPCLSEGLQVGRELDSDCLWTWLSRTWWNDRPVKQMLYWFPESTAKHHCTKMLCSMSGRPPLGICRITQGSRLWTDGTHVASGLDQWPAGVRFSCVLPQLWELVTSQREEPVSLRMTTWNRAPWKPAMDMKGEN